MKFYNSKEGDIHKRLHAQNLNIQDLKRPYGNQSHNLFYYDNIQIINKDSLDILNNNLDYKLNDKIIYIKGFFSDAKVIIFLDEIGSYIINIGQRGTVLKSSRSNFS